MKSLNLKNLVVFALALTVVATGCKRKPGYTTPLPGQITRPQNPPPVLPGGRFNPEPSPSPTTTAPLSQPGPEDGFNGLGDPAPLAPQTVHFAFDSSNVGKNERAHLDAVAAFMRSESNVKVSIEGHCDERGTEEYNRSLGERRALALREALIALGIDPMRLRTLSFGEDKPADTGHGESAWAKNRRGEFIVYRPK